jgi:prepilin-type N-terminal cleavage/methylation domain-containing protein
MKKGFTLIEMMIVVAIIAIIAAIAIPSLLAARRSSLETNAVGSCRTFCGAQTMYKRNDWDAIAGGGPQFPTGLETIGVLEYAQDLRDLNACLDGNLDPVNLVDAAFANAKSDQVGAGYGMGAGNGQPKHGYLFAEMLTIAGSAIDWVNDYGMCACPSVYGRTGYRSFIVCTNGTVFGKDVITNVPPLFTEDAEFADYPADPQLTNWIIAE